MSRQTIEKIEEAVTHRGVGEGCVAYFVRNISDLSGIITLGNQKPNKSFFSLVPFSEICTNTQGEVTSHNLW